MTKRDFEFRRLRKAEAEAILSWRFEPEYDYYNVKPKNRERLLREFLEPRNSYYSMLDENDQMLAYCCYGRSARVYGGDYSVEALDMGLTMRPNMTGQGFGSSFAKAVVEHGIRKFSPGLLRVTIARFNERAIRVWEKNDFVVCSEFDRPADRRKFKILYRRAGHQQDAERILSVSGGADTNNTRNDTGILE